MNRKTGKKEKDIPEVEVIREITVEGLPEAYIKQIIPMTLEDKVLDYINKHPDGVKILDMEEPMGEKRMKLGFVGKNLLDEGKVLKIGNIYYPKTRNEG